MSEDIGEKEYLLNEIKDLIADDVLIEVKYLEFLEIEELYNIKELLESKKENFIKDNIDWLKSFQN